MADEQDRPDEKPDNAAGDNEAGDAVAPEAGAEFGPPAAEPPAKKAPAKPAKEAAAKKAPDKAVKKAAPAKKAPQKSPVPKAPPRKASPTPEPAAAGQLADTNGDGQVVSAAKEAAAQAKSTVASAPNPVSGPALVPSDGLGQSRLPLAAAIAAGVLAILMVLLARRRSEDG